MKCHSENSPSGICPFRELSFRGTALRGTVCRGNVFEEMSVGEKLIGEMSVEELSAVPHINPETNLPPPIINDVCKYLRQFLGPNFGAATLQICCNIE